MLIHELKLNDDKTEYIIVQSKHYDQKYGTTGLDMIDFTFESGTTVRNLGAYFDEHMSIKKTCDRGLLLCLLSHPANLQDSQISHLRRVCQRCKISYNEQN